MSAILDSINNVKSNWKIRGIKDNNKHDGTQGKRNSSKWRNGKVDKQKKNFLSCWNVSPTTVVKNFHIAIKNTIKQKLSDKSKSDEK